MPIKSKYDTAVTEIPKNTNSKFVDDLAVARKVPTDKATAIVGRRKGTYQNIRRKPCGSEPVSIK